MSYNGNGQNKERKNSGEGMSDSQAKEWIEQGNTKELVSRAELQAQKIAKKVKTNQIRRIYGPVIKIQEQLSAGDNKWERELSMLKPRVFYASAREKNLKPLQEDIVKFIKVIENFKADKKKAVKSFCVFMEALVAYHKWYDKNSDKKKHEKKSSFRDR